MKLIFSRFTLVAACAALALAACNNNNATPAPFITPTTGPTSQPTSGPGKTYMQLDRLSRPAVNEVFATFQEHQQNNVATPNDDAKTIGPDIYNFTTTVAGRSPDIANVLVAVLVPDVQIADMNGTSQSCLGVPLGTCNNYLGIETGGVTQAPAGLKPFGGRALTDDVVDISLSAIFGSVIPALKLAPDDGNELDGRADPSYKSGYRPNLTTDNVSAADKHFTTTFPYLGTPR